MLLDEFTEIFLNPINYFLILNQHLKRGYKIPTHIFLLHFKRINFYYNQYNRNIRAASSLGEKAHVRISRILRMVNQVDLLLAIGISRSVKPQGCLMRLLCPRESRRPVEPLLLRDRA